VEKVEIHEHKQREIKVEIMYCTILLEDPAYTFINNNNMQAIEGMTAPEYKEFEVHSPTKMVPEEVPASIPKQTVIKAPEEIPVSIPGAIIFKAPAEVPVLIPEKVFVKGSEEVTIDTPQEVLSTALTRCSNQYERVCEYA
jgi:hypothetical protein